LSDLKDEHTQIEDLNPDRLQAAQASYVDIMKNACNRVPPEQSTAINRLIDNVVAMVKRILSAFTFPSKAAFFKSVEDEDSKMAKQQDIDLTEQPVELKVPS